MPNFRNLSIYDESSGKVRACKHLIPIHTKCFHPQLRLVSEHATSEWSPLFGKMTRHYHGRWRTLWIIDLWPPSLLSNPKQHILKFETTEKNQHPLSLSVFLRVSRLTETDFISSQMFTQDFSRNPIMCQKTTEQHKRRVKDSVSLSLYKYGKMQKILIRSESVV